MAKYLFYSICSLCNTEDTWCDVPLTGFPCTRCRLLKKKCCTRDRKAKRTMENCENEDDNGLNPTTVTSETAAKPDAFNFDIGRYGGMAENPCVGLTSPLDNLITEVTNFLGPGIKSSSKPELPPFIQEIPAWIAKEDIHYLKSKEVFTVVDDILCRELLRSFIECVYPFLPVLDLDSLLMAFCHKGRCGKISLLLFHAVMFSAVAFVDMKHLYNAGYQSRREAREEFFSKTRTLYDFDYEKDRIILIQALLLMTYWHESPENPKDSRYWLDVCWSLGSSIGLHRDPSSIAQTTPNHRKIWKRLWWCLYTRNRLFALNLRRPISFKKNGGNLSIPLVTLEDFDIHQYPDTAISAFEGCDFLWSKSLQEHSALSFIEKAKLSILISEVTILRDGDGSPGESENGEAAGAWTGKYGKILENLHLWQAQIPTELQPNNLLVEGFLGNKNKIVHVQCAWLHLVFLATVATLYRQHNDCCVHPPQVDIPQGPYRQVLQQMSSTVQDIHQLGLIQLLPTTTVALLVPVLAMYLSDLKSDSRVLHITSFQNFYRCMAVLESLGNTYSSAIAIRLFFEDALANIGSISDSLIIPSMIQDLLTKKELELIFKASNNGCQEPPGEIVDPNMIMMDASSNGSLFLDGRLEEGELFVL